MAGTQFLCFGEYILYQSKDNYLINSCDTIEIFYNIRTDLDKINYAVILTKIIQDVTDENENCYKILQLYLNTLYMISETDKDMYFVLSIFKIKLLSITGFLPRLNSCTNCGEKEKITHFSIKDDGVKCIECATQDKSAISISPSTLVALRFIVSMPPRKVFNFNLKDDSLRELKLLSKVYFEQKLEKEYKA